MLQAIFNRPTQHLKIFYRGILARTYTANGDAWGNGGPNSPYGHDCSIAPGHYKLTQVERINPPIASEGPGQIYVADLTGQDYWALVKTGKVKVVGTDWSIGGITLPAGGLTKYGRAEIMCHAGGSNAPEPLADRQILCRTYGCTRMFNCELVDFMDFLEPILAAKADHVIFSVVGDSPALPQ